MLDVRSDLEWDGLDIFDMEAHVNEWPSTLMMKLDAKRRQSVPLKHGISQATCPCVPEYLFIAILAISFFM